MSGRKQSQRTKNNVRPSSSSRSAELLNHSFNLDGGLMTISGGKVLPALFPTLATVNIDQGLNPDYQMCIKKLNKKDPITRAKALQELCELVNNGNVDDAVAVLPTWAHFYKTLTADTDRKVREMTQLCQGALVRACGRRTAPQLKALLPAWLQAQYDEHAPAMAHAQNSLKSTFPDSKLPEVISFCKTEVMAHLLENLIGNTEAIVTKKIENPDERELQMCRIITSSLRGLEFFVPQLPASHHEWLWSALTPLLDANAYWKMAMHNMHQVRAAWYGALGRVAERFRAQFAERHGVRTVRALLSAARETNALVAAQIWTCLLQFMHNVQDWQKYLEKKELLLKRLLDVLETGGWGDARHLSTMLLPLLAHLPQDVLTKEFYEAFFNAIYKGLDKKNIITSKSERQSWITSLAECLRYLSIQENDFLVEVVTSVHRTWLEKMLSSQHDVQTRNNLIKCSATNMTSLVKYWLKQSKEGKSEKYDQLLRNFWQNIGSTVLTQIDRCSTDLVEIESLIDAHILLLQTLKMTFSQETKKQLSIKFEKSVEDDENAVNNSPVIAQQCDASIVDRYNHNLDELVHKIISHYFETAEKKQAANSILTPLITLLTEFDSAAVYVAVARQLGADSASGLYRRLRKWLAEDTMRCKAVVDILFLMIKYLKEDEQDAVFESFQQLTPAVTEWCLARAVSHPHVQQRAARRWARSAAAAGALHALARRATRHRDSAAAHLLLVCLADGPDGEPLISEAGVSQVMTTVSSAIALAGDGEADSESAPQLEFSARLAARLVTALAPSPPLTHAQAFAALVLRLFRLIVLVPRGSARLPASTWCEARSSWHDGLGALGALGPAARRGFLEDAARLFTTLLFKQINNLDIQKIEQIVSLAPYLFVRGDESKLPDDITELITFTKQIFNMDTEESLAVETYALRHECVTSQLNCLCEDNEAVKKLIKDSAEQDITELSKLDLTVYVNKLLFRAIYLRTLLLHKAASENDDDDDSDVNTWCDTLLSNEYLETEFCKVLHDYSIVVSLNEGYTFWPHYNIIEKTKSKMDALLSDIISATSEALRQKLLTSLRELASAKGYFWAYAHRFYSLSARSEEGEESVCDSDKRVVEHTDSGYVHMMQCVGKYGGADAARRAAHAGLLRARGDLDLDLDLLVQEYRSCEATVAFDGDISKAPWSAVVSSASVLEFLRLSLEGEGRPAPWDFINSTLRSVFTSICDSMDNWGSTKVALVSRAALRLLCAALPLLQRAAAHGDERGAYADWSRSHEGHVYDCVYTLVAHILDNCQSRCMTVPQSAVLSALMGALGAVDWHRSARAARRRALDEAGAAVRALERPAPPALRFLAYHLLLNLAKPLVYDDAQKIVAWSESDEEKKRPTTSLDSFRSTFKRLQEIVDATLQNVELGEEICELVSMSDSHSMTLGWLLLVDAQAHMCDLAVGDLKQFYIQIYRKSDYVPGLLAAALRLLPGAVFAFALDSCDRAPAPPHYSDMFLRVEPFSMRSACQSRTVQALACRCVYSSVCGAGCGAARGWWGAARPRVARALQRLVGAYVAPAAVAEQLGALQHRAKEIEDAEIRIAWSTSEVVCEYSVEESTLELRVWLSRSHPLTPPRLEAPGLAGASTTHWLALYLAYQNGTLLNALKMWTQVVNARVEKSPQCYICYCRLHPSTGRLPHVACHQCRNKFHNLCLRKWFATSNKSNCPLCRATF